MLQYGKNIEMAPVFFGGKARDRILIPRGRFCSAWLIDPPVPPKFDAYAHRIYYDETLVDAQSLEWDQLFDSTSEYFKKEVQNKLTAHGIQITIRCRTLGVGGDLFNSIRLLVDFERQCATKRGKTQQLLESSYMWVKIVAGESKAEETPREDTMYHLYEYRHGVIHYTCFRYEAVDRFTFRFSLDRFQAQHLFDRDTNLGPMGISYYVQADRVRLAMERVSRKAGQLRMRLGTFVFDLAALIFASAATSTSAESNPESASAVEALNTILPRLGLAGLTSVRMDFHPADPVTLGKLRSIYGVAYSADVNEDGISEQLLEAIYQYIAKSWYCLNELKLPASFVTQRLSSKIRTKAKLPMGVYMYGESTGLYSYTFHGEVAEELKLTPVTINHRGGVKRGTMPLPDLSGGLEGLWSL